MSSFDSRRAAEVLAGRAAAVSRVVGRAFTMVVLLGVAAAVAVLALYLTFDASGARAIAILYAVVIALAAARLVFHRLALARSLGPRSGLADELQRLLGRTTATTGHASDGTVSSSTTVVVVDGTGRSSFDAAGLRQMDDLRQLNSELALAGLAKRTHPLRARAIGLSTLAVVTVVLLTVLAPLLLIAGLLAKLIG